MSQHVLTNFMLTKRKLRIINVCHAGILVKLVLGPVRLIVCHVRGDFCFKMKARGL